MEPGVGRLDADDRPADPLGAAHDGRWICLQGVLSKKAVPTSYGGLVNLLSRRKWISTVCDWPTGGKAVISSTVLAVSVSGISISGVSASHDAGC